MGSRRLEKLPPYLFVEIDRLKESYARSGRPVLDLGIGDPDLGAPPALVRLLKSAIDRREYHRYPDDRGLPILVDAIRRWAARLHGVDLDREEILVTIGSKEAIGHLPLAIVDGGDVVLVPDPGYPVYHSSAVFAGAESVRVPLDPNDGWWPDLRGVPEETIERAKLLYLNYPNNPTAAVAGVDRFAEALAFCRDAGIVLVNDAAYGEVTYGERAEPLFPAARESGVPFIEFFSFSKTFSITGWRIGFAVGSPEVVSALARVKANIDSGVFGAIQETAAVALDDLFDDLVGRMRAVYIERRNVLARSLERSGLDFTVPEATFYFWIRTPGEGGSIEFCRALLEERGIVATPGVGFGPGGEGFFRLSITTDIETIREAGRKLEGIRQR